MAPNQAHAFRKMDIALSLPHADVFKKMRAQYVKQLDTKENEAYRAKLLQSPHFSIAWDFVLLPQDVNCASYPNGALSQIDRILEREVYLRGQKLRCDAAPRSVLVCMLASHFLHPKYDGIRFQIVQRLLPTLDIELGEFISFFKKHRKQWSIVQMGDKEDAMTCRRCQVDVPFFVCIASCTACEVYNPVCSTCWTSRKKECYKQFFVFGNCKDCKKRKLRNITYESRHKSAGRMLELFAGETFLRFLSADTAISQTEKGRLSRVFERVSENLSLMKNHEAPVIK